MANRLPPVPTPEQRERAALKHHLADLDREREAASDARAETLRTQRALELANLRELTLKHALTRGRTEAQATQLCTAVEQAHAAWVAAGRVGHFDFYAAVKRCEFELGHVAVAPAGMLSGTALDASLPPARGEARAPLHDGDATTREQAQRAAAERGRALAEQVRKDREAYRAALRRHGLEDPATGTRGNRSGSGLGF